MENKCDPKCVEWTGGMEKDPQGRKLMLAQWGNKKYRPLELHPQCQACKAYQDSIKKKPAPTKQAPKEDYAAITKATDKASKDAQDALNDAKDLTGWHHR